MAPKNKSGGDKKGKGKGGKADGAGEDKKDKNASGSGKVKGAQQINVRHILVSCYLVSTKAGRTIERRI